MKNLNWRAGEAGQAAAETALVLPLLLFLVLGTLQLFLVLQARMLAQYAVYKAVRAGSVGFGDCERMKQAAILSLLPSITQTQDGARLARAFLERRSNRYHDGSPRHAGQIIELVREQPTGAGEQQFDQPGNGAQLEVRMLYWYRLRVPFADWALGRMFLAHYGFLAYRAVDPLAPRRKARWSEVTTPADEGWPGGPLATNMAGWAAAGHYLVPIKVHSVMRMMTPPKAAFFSTPECPL